jgi:type IV pilus assembly protein PilA
METYLILKYCGHQRSRNGGFTLIELLVVVVIMGILAAIGLPSMLSQAGRANQARAQNSIGAINRAQQAYFMENSAFAPDLNTLKIGNLTLVGYDIIVTATLTTAEAEAAPTRIGLMPYCGTVSTTSSGTQALSTATISSGTCP